MTVLLQVYAKKDKKKEDLNVYCNIQVLETIDIRPPVLGGQLLGFRGGYGHRFPDFGTWLSCIYPDKGFSLCDCLYRQDSDLFLHVDKDSSFNERTHYQNTRRNAHRAVPGDDE